MEVETQSAVLNEEEVSSTLNDSEEGVQATQLPSDQTEFEVPDKFKGKSVEDVIKSYQELEKLKSIKKDEEAPTEEVDEVEPTDQEIETYNKYAASFDADGALSEAEYAELAAMGYDKATVDAEIEAYKEQKEFQTYKQEKALADVIQPLGGGTEKFKEVAMWANQNKAPEEVAEFNEALAASSKIAQQAMLRGLYAEYESAGNAVDTILHTNTPQSLPSKGYRTQEEFFKDIGSEEYKNNAAYRKAVEDKMSKSNIF